MCSYQIGLRYINDTTVRVTYVTNIPTIGAFDTATAGSAKLGRVASIVRISKLKGGSTASRARAFFGCTLHTTCDPNGPSKKIFNPRMSVPCAPDKGNPCCHFEKL